MGVRLRPLRRVTEKSVAVAGFWFFLGATIPAGAVASEAFAENGELMGASYALSTERIEASGGQWDYSAPEIVILREVDQVMPIALEYVGTPYRLGGKTPKGFDCSGFTKWVYAEVGYTLPEGADAQARAGVVVSQEEARPGDLVVWPGHVAIYAGDGNRIDANHAGSSVQVRPLFGNPTFIRVLP